MPSSARDIGSGRTAHRPRTPGPKTACAHRSSAIGQGDEDHARRRPAPGTKAQAALLGNELFSQRPPRRLRVRQLSSRDRPARCMLRHSSSSARYVPRRFRTRCNPSNATTRRNAGLHSARGRIFPRLTSDGQFARDDRTRPHLLIPIQIPPRDAKWLSHSPGRARVPRARAALLGALLCDCRRHKQFNPPSCIALASPRASPQTSSTTAGKTRPFVFPRYLRTVRQSALPYGIDSREQGLIWKMAMARLPGVHKRPCGTGGAEAH